MSLTNGVITAIPAPEGYVVNFENPQRTGNIAAYAVCAVGMVLAFLFMAQRLYVKVIVRRSFGFDDVCLVLAWAFTVSLQVIIIRGFAVGYIGTHAFEMPITEFMVFFKYSVYINTIIYAPPTMLAKLVILLFYNSLQNQERWFRYSVWFAMFVTVGSSTGIFFSSIFSCKPLAMGWDLTITTGVCIDRTAMFKATAALGVIVDILIIAIPIPMVSKLQMSRSKKASLLFVFSIGSITVITSIIRLVLLITSLSDTDTSWGAGPIHVWICVESNLLIMCASLPTVRLFVRTVAPNLMSSSGASGAKSAGYAGHSGRSKTIGGSSMPGPGTNPRRNHYGRFDDSNDLEYGMETLVEGRKGNVDVGTKHLGDSETGWEDGNSDRAIMQTTTTAITYSQKPHDL